MRPEQKRAAPAGTGHGPRSICGFSHSENNPQTWFAQPAHFGGVFVGYLIDRTKGQVEAAPTLEHSLGWYNSHHAALHALIAHAISAGVASNMAVRGAD